MSDILASIVGFINDVKAAAWDGTITPSREAEIRAETAAAIIRAGGTSADLQAAQDLITQTIATANPASSITQEVESWLGKNWVTVALALGGVIVVTAVGGLRR